MKAHIVFISVWVCYLAGSMALAGFNDIYRLSYERSGMKEKFKHWAWAAFYFLCCLFSFWIFENWFLVFSLFLIHLSIFPIVCNMLAERPVFNLNKNSKLITDRILIKLGFKDTEVLNVTAFVISIILLMCSFLK